MAHSCGETKRVTGDFCQVSSPLLRIKDLTTKRGQVDPKERNWIFVYA